MEYFRGVGFDTKADCGGDCVQCGDKWFVPCQQGYSSSIDCQVCRSSPTNPKGRQTTVWTYVIYFVMIVIALYFLYRIFTAPTITSNTVPDIILGTPGIDDPYSTLQNITQPSPDKIYV